MPLQFASKIFAYWSSNANLKSDVALSQTLAPKLRTLSDPQLLQMGINCITEVRSGRNTISALNGFVIRQGRKFPIKVVALALVCEAIRRELGFSPYPVQMLAALAVSNGTIIDMKTGEGKSIVAVMSAYLGALRGEGVHVATCNAYLAERDAHQARSILERLGISVGVVLDNSNASANHCAYQRDITFGPGYQFGFDFLMDQSRLRARNTNQLGQHIHDLLCEQSSVDLIQTRPPTDAIVDEADSVLIDEATTPMILSGSPATQVGISPSEVHSRKDARFVYQLAKSIADKMEAGNQFTLKHRRVELLPCGLELAHFAFQKLNGQHLERPWKIYVENALLAKHVYRRNEHYVVAEDEVRIVDQQTGRIFEDRSWQNGLHQAIEVEEGVPITPTRQVVARITRQRFFQRYERVGGMTGTLFNLGLEMLRTYHSNSLVIPSHLPCQRRRFNSRFFDSWENKLTAIATEAQAMSRRGRPVLIGTRSIERSLLIHDILTRLGASPVILNGLQDRTEAEVISQAGQCGTITVATNMAGRGTDIKLSDAARQQGGLHVIVSEPHESTRTDLQLIGRAARQGDPGSYRIYASCCDPLFESLGKSWIKRMRNKRKPSGEIDTSIDSVIKTIQASKDRSCELIRERMMQRDQWLDTVKVGYESIK